MKSLTLAWIIVLITFTSCKNEGSRNNQPGCLIIELDPRYAAVKTIIAIANCSGPTGNYITEVHSTRNGYTYFHQEEGTEFEVSAILQSEDVGYALDSSGNREDTIPKIMREVIRGHEFHKISMFPDQFFSEITYAGKEKFRDQKCQTYIALEHPDHRVKLFYDNKKKLILGFETVSTLNTDIIEVFYQDWEESPFGRLVRKVEIVQAKRDTFRFQFDSISINDKAFKKLHQNISH